MSDDDFSERGSRSSGGSRASKAESPGVLFLGDAHCRAFHTLTKTGDTARVCGKLASDCRRTGHSASRAKGNIGPVGMYDPISTGAPNHDWDGAGDTYRTSYFRQTYAYPILELQQLSGEPTLQRFLVNGDNLLRKKIYSMHSWRRAGRSRVSRGPRHDEPTHPQMRTATAAEIHEHGRWRYKINNKKEDMSTHYNQWELPDRLAITLLGM